MSDYALELRQVSKSFAGVRVLHDVSLQLKAGEVRALVGANGSGKSTLIKILTGYHAPDAGAEIRCWGEPVELPVRSPHAHGIAVIHQDLGLCDELTVLENFGAGSRYGARPHRPVGWARERARARALLERFEVELDPEALVGSLEPTERAMLAIVRAVRQLEDQGEGQLFILDEPTTYLTSDDAARVMRLVRRVADGGAAVLFVSHRLSEVTAIGDAVSVLRDGRLVATLALEEAGHERILQLMLGRTIGDFYPDKLPRRAGAAEQLLRVRGLSGASIEQVDFDVHAGELLGITGLAGMGQDELPYLLVGWRPRRAGEVRPAWLQKPLPARPAAAIESGIALVPANRGRDSVWLEGTALENATLPVLSRYLRGGRLRHSREQQDVAELMVRFNVVPPLPERAIGTFSGGNQQKVVLAKWLQLDPRVLLLHEPTQGVDAGARKDVLEMVRATAERGAGVVLFSADYEQIAHVCQRVLVLRHGRIGEQLSGADVTEERIVQACQGFVAEEAA